MSPKPFALAVKAVIFDAQGRCLLIRRSAHNRNFIGCWEWPGGKVDLGEDFAEAVTREAREETGLEIELTRLVGATQFEMPKVIVVLLCMEARPTGSGLKLSEEHDQFEWVDPKDIPARELAPQVAQFMVAYAHSSSHTRSRKET